MENDFDASDHDLVVAVDDNVDFDDVGETSCCCSVAYCLWRNSSVDLTDVDSSLSPTGGSLSVDLFDDLFDDSSVDSFDDSSVDSFVGAVLGGNYLVDNVHFVACQDLNFSFEIGYNYWSFGSFESDLESDWD